MPVLSSEEFNRQSTLKSSSSERIYQGKSIKQGPVFSLENSNAAKLYCRIFDKTENGAICIIVREESFLRVWSQIHTNERSSRQPLTVNSEPEISINDIPINPEFIKICQQQLAAYIGPIAKIICKKALAKKSHMTRNEFVEVLAKKMPDSNKAQEFKQELLE